MTPSKETHHKTSIANKQTRIFSAAVGQRIRAIREARGMSLSDFQKALKAAGVIVGTPSALCHWETGNRAVPIGMLPTIATALRCDVCSLLPEEDQL